MSRHPWAALGAAVLCGAVAGAGGAIDVALPLVGLESTATALPLPALLAAALVAVAVGCADAGEAAWMGGAVRRPADASALFTGVVVLAGVAVAAALSALSPMALFARNAAVLALLAEAVKCIAAARRMAAPASSSSAVPPGVLAGAAPVLLLAVSATFARDPSGGVYAWAWLVRRDLGNPMAMLTALAGLAVVVACRLVSSPRFVARFVRNSA